MASLLPRAGAGADQSPDAAVGAGIFDRFVDELAVVRRIELAESQAVVNVTPRVKLDPQGGFLVADASEAQIRRYAANGALVTDFGRKGRGPGEFLRLSTALRTGRDGIVAVEMNGRISRFNATGRLAGTTRQSPLGPVYNATLVGDTLLVLAGRLGGRGDTPLLHVWSLRGETLVRSFFRAPPAPNGLEGTYAFAGTADVTARGDTLAAVFALSDTVYLFDASGRTLEKIAIPFRGFRRPSERMPVRASIDEYRSWASRFSAISQVFWEPDGSFLVQYFDTNGVEPSWRLLRMTRRGELRFELKDSPQLLAVAPSGRELYFVRPGAETAASWIAARPLR